MPYLDYQKAVRIIYRPSGNCWAGNLYMDNMPRWTRRGKNPAAIPQPLPGDTLQRLTHTELAWQIEQKRDRNVKQRYDAIQNLFSTSEEVYRQGENVLLHTYALNFPAGSSEIHAENFGLLNKIIDAINTFNQARINVFGIPTQPAAQRQISACLNHVRKRSCPS